jgi:hypothetical protein
MNRRSGLTLAELMVTVAVIGTFFLVVSGLVLAIRDTEEVTRTYGRELSELRRAVRVIESDLRTATDVDDLDVRLDGGCLVRGDRVLARNVSVFEVTRDGPLARVRIGLGAGSPGRRGDLAFSVRLRYAGGPR